MNVEFYMNKETGEVTESHDEAVKWYRSGACVGLYVKNKERCSWSHGLTTVK